MSENTTLGWGDVEVDESVSEIDLKKAADLSMSAPVGKFLCIVGDVKPIEIAFKAYSCIAAEIPLIIKDVLEIEKPVFDDAGKPVMRNGEQLTKRMPIQPGKEKNELNALLSGAIITDEVPLYKAQEKDFFKKRRLYVAQKIGIIDTTNAVLTGQMWASAKGMEVIVTTGWDHYNDKTTGEPKKKVKVATDGYESVSKSVVNVDQATNNTPDFSDI